jgi:hypothetical protein
MSCLRLNFWQSVNHGFRTAAVAFKNKVLRNNADAHLYGYLLFDTAANLLQARRFSQIEVALKRRQAQVNTLGSLPLGPKVRTSVSALSRLNISGGRNGEGSGTISPRAPLRHHPRRHRCPPSSQGSAATHQSRCHTAHHPAAVPRRLPASIAAHEQGVSPAREQDLATPAGAAGFGGESSPQTSRALKVPRARARARARAQGSARTHRRALSRTGTPRPAQTRPFATVSGQRRPRPEQGRAAAALHAPPSTR